MSAEDVRNTLFVVARSLTFAAQGFLFGLVPILLLELRPALFGGDLKEGQTAAAVRVMAVRLEDYVRLALALAAGATVASLALQTWRLSDVSAEGIGSSLDALATSNFGIWHLARLAVLLPLAVVLVGRVGEQSLTPEAEGGAPRLWWATWTALGLALLATTALGGHASEGHPEGLAVVNDIVHVAASGVWFAGILVQTRVLPHTWRNRSRRQQLRMLGPNVVRFSSLAPVSVAFIVVTGVVSVALNVGALDDLGDTDYGQALLTKLAFFALVVMLGGFNHYVLVPHVREALERRRWTDAQLELHRSLVLELVLALVLFGMTGVLTGLARTA